MRRWIRRWPARKQEDSELSEELRAHLAIEADQRMETGESREDAARAARRVFGNIAHIEEEVRESWGWPESSALARMCALGYACCAGRPYGPRSSPQCLPWEWA